MTSTLQVPENNSRRPVDAERYPILSRIYSPADLRNLEINDLTALCGDIRKFLIDNLSSNPGHFGSSMGAVELTVALHYVFNTPYDRIVWDVGHQAYGHKLLTGRAERFHTNRTLGGLSGFPTPAESTYDTFAAGHASNAISAALGMAVASHLKADEPRRNVVAVIGDASISGGLAFEGLNNAANSNADLLIILNDNDMSIDHNVGSLNSYLAHLNTSKSYNALRFRVYNFLRKAHLIKEKHRGRILRFNNSLKSLISREQNIFEGLDIRYFGPFDGHDLPRIIRTLRDIRDIKGPRILHLRTVKGRGYAPAEQDPATWHAPGTFNPATGERKPEDPSAPPRWQDIFGETLTELAAKNKSIVGITAAMPSGTSMSMMQKAFPDRTFDVGISEGHAVTFAGGLAKDGMTPVVAIYSSFLQRAYDHIIHDVALLDLPVIFAIDRAGIVGEDGATHHGLLDLSYLSDIPGMTIASPSTPGQLRNLLYTAQLPGRKGPFAIRYPRGRANAADIPESGVWQSPMKILPIGRGRRLTEGSDVTILSLGPIARKVDEAVRQAKDKGISAAHYDMIFLQPLDNDIMLEAAKAGKPIITVEDASIKGGLGSAVIEWLNDNGYDLPVTRLGTPKGRFVPHATVDELHNICHLSSGHILQAILQATKSK